MSTCVLIYFVNSFLAAHSSKTPKLVLSKSYKTGPICVVIAQAAVSAHFVAFNENTNIYSIYIIYIYILYSRRRLGLVDNYKMHNASFILPQENRWDEDIYSEQKGVLNPYRGHLEVVI